MLLFRCSVAFIAVLSLANCSKDSTASGGFTQRLNSIAKAFSSYTSLDVPQGAAPCSRPPQPCSPPSRRTAVASRPSVQQNAQEPARSPEGTRASAAYTIIASAENWRLLSELTTTLNADGLRVLPVVGLSARGNLNDIQHNSVDFAIVPANAYVKQAKGDIRYVSRLPAETLHIVARRGLTSIRQLDGRRVNVGPPGSGSEIAAQALFDAEGIAPIVTTEPADVAQERLRSGEIDASVLLVAPRAFPAASLPRGFHLLPIPPGTLAGEAYEPTLIEASLYPDLIEDGRAVPSVAVANVLAVSDAPSGTARGKRLNRFVREFYQRVDLLRDLESSSQWEDLNPAEGVAGWQRF
jgi:TRAP-type uncharacterized transport system substrate-binding protein